MDMDAKMESFSAWDDTALGGLAIFCDSLDGSLPFNQHILDYDYGYWVNNLRNDTPQITNRTLFCSSKVRWEDKQGYFADDSALNGLALGVCRDYIRQLSGTWNYVASVNDGTIPFSYPLNLTVMGIF